MTTTAPAAAPTRQIAFDYDRTVVAFHGTRKSTAEKLVSGVPFDQSENDDDWLGHGIYFWEYAPQQAWWWAERRYGDDAAVVGALVRLGRCIDLLDPSNATLLMRAHDDLDRMLAATKQKLKSNANNHKYRDCAVFNYLFETLRRAMSRLTAHARCSSRQRRRACLASGNEAAYSAVRTSSSPCESQTTSWRFGR